MKPLITVILISVLLLILIILIVVPILSIFLKDKSKFFKEINELFNYNSFITMFTTNLFLISSFVIGLFLTMKNIITGENEAIYSKEYDFFQEMGPLVTKGGESDPSQTMITPDEPMVPSQTMITPDEPLMTETIPKISEEDKKITVIRTLKDLKEHDIIPMEQFYHVRRDKNFILPNYLSEKNIPKCNNPIKKEDFNYYDVFIKQNPYQLRKTNINFIWNGNPYVYQTEFVKEICRRRGNGDNINEILFKGPLNFVRKLNMETSRILYWVDPEYIESFEKILEDPSLKELKDKIYLCSFSLLWKIDIISFLEKDYLIENDDLNLSYLAKIHIDETGTKNIMKEIYSMFILYLVGGYFFDISCSITNEENKICLPIYDRFLIPNNILYNDEDVITDIKDIKPLKETIELFPDNFPETGNDLYLFFSPPQNIVVKIMLKYMFNLYYHSFLDKKKLDRRSVSEISKTDIEEMILFKNELISLDLLFYSLPSPHKAESVRLNKWQSHIRYAMNRIDVLDKYSFLRDHFTFIPTNNFIQPPNDNYGRYFMFGNVKIRKIYKSSCWQVYDIAFMK